MFGNDSLKMRVFRRHRSLFQEALRCTFYIPIHLISTLCPFFSVNSIPQVLLLSFSRDLTQGFPNCGELTQSRNDGKRHATPRNFGNFWEIPLLTVQDKKMKVLLLNLVCSPCFWVSPLALRSEPCQDGPNHKKQPVLRSKSRVVMVRDESIMRIGAQTYSGMLKKPFQTSMTWLQESCWKFFRLSRNGFFFRINSGLWWGALSKLFDKGPTGLQFSLGMSDCDPPSRHASLNPSLTSASDIGLTCHRFWRFQQKNPAS